MIDQKSVNLCFFLLRNKGKEKKIANCQGNGSECKLLFPNTYKEFPPNIGISGSLGRFKETKFQHLQTLDQNEGIHSCFFRIPLDGGIIGRTVPFSIFFINVSISTWKIVHPRSMKEWVTLTKNLKIMFRHVLRLKQSTNRRLVISFSHLPVSKCTIK